MRYQQFCRPNRYMPVIAVSIVAALVLQPIPPVTAATTNAPRGRQAYLDAAKSYVEKGNLKAAEIELRNAEREAPRDAHIRAMLADVYVKLGQFTVAAQEARIARDLKGDEAEYVLPLAEA